MIVAGLLMIRMVKGWNRFNFNGPSVIVTDFSINENGSDKLFEIRGRVSGLLSMMFNKFNLETSFIVYADKDGYFYHFQTPISQLREFTPYHQVAGTAVGMSRNTIWLKGLIFFGMSLCYYIYYGISTYVQYEETISVVLLPILIIAAGLCFAGFIYSKRIVLLVESSGSLPVWIKFSESVLEQKNISKSHLERIIGIINKKVTEAKIQ